MKKSPLRLLVAIASLALLACAPPKAPRPDPAHVESHSGGILSKNDTVKVVFIQDLGARAGTELRESPIALKPAASGKAVWLDGRTLEFRPDRPLKAATIYRTSVDMKKAGSPGSDFQFEFAVLSLLRFHQRSRLKIFLCVYGSSSRGIESRL